MMDNIKKVLLESINRLSFSKYYLHTKMLWKTLSNDMYSPLNKSNIIYTVCLQLTKTERISKLISLYFWHRLNKHSYQNISFNGEHHIGAWLTTYCSMASILAWQYGFYWQKLAGYGLSDRFPSLPLLRRDFPKRWTVGK